MITFSQSLRKFFERHIENKAEGFVGNLVLSIMDNLGLNIRVLNIENAITSQIITRLKDALAIRRVIQDRIHELVSTDVEKSDKVLIAITDKKHGPPNLRPMLFDKASIRSMERIPDWDALDLSAIDDLSYKEFNALLDQADKLPFPSEWGKDTFREVLGATCYFSAPLSDEFIATVISAIVGVEDFGRTAMILPGIHRNITMEDWPELLLTLLCLYKKLLDIREQLTKASDKDA